jgi:hypothetical protein
MSIRIIEQELDGLVVHLCDQGRRLDAALLEAEMFECTDLACLRELRDKWFDELEEANGAKGRI